MAVQVLEKSICISEYISRRRTRRPMHQSIARQRLYTHQEILLLADLAQLKLVASYGDLQEPQEGDHIPDDEPDGWERLVLCFKQTGS